MIIISNTSSCLYKPVFSVLKNGRTALFYKWKHFMKCTTPKWSKKHNESVIKVVYDSHTIVQAF